MDIDVGPAWGSEGEERRREEIGCLDTQRYEVWIGFAGLVIHGV